MSSEKDLFGSEDFKYWLRSGSLHFARDRKAAGKPVASFHRHGREIFYRPGSSDLTIIYRLLLKPPAKREYHFPEGLKPRVILDIGANIGVATIALKERYPEAFIHAFEPSPENVELLERNTAGYENVHLHPFALGDANGTLDLFYSDDPKNFGGCSFHEAGIDPQKKAVVDVKKADDYLDAVGVRDVDLIKIDTEGSEYAILKSFDPVILSRTQWILGELHGNQDFELLAYLATWFDVGVTKPVQSRLGVFEARNRSLGDSAQYLHT